MEGKEGGGEVKMRKRGKGEKGEEESKEGEGRQTGDLNSAGEVRRKC